MASDVRPKCKDWLIEILACPACEGRPALVETDEDSPLPPSASEGDRGRSGLRCEKCERIYPVVDGLPILVTDRATGSAYAEPQEGAGTDDS
jgi:uncharacterized protein YbaR (Trm112 family)